MKRNGEAPVMRTSLRSRHRTAADFAVGSGQGAPRPLVPRETRVFDGPLAGRTRSGRGGRSRGGPDRLGRVRERREGAVKSAVKFGLLRRELLPVPPVRRPARAE